MHACYKEQRTVNSSKEYVLLENPFFVTLIFFLGGRASDPEQQHFFLTILKVKFFIDLVSYDNPIDCACGRSSSPEREGGTCNAAPSRLDTARVSALKREIKVNRPTQIASNPV